MSRYRRYERYKDSGVEWIGEIPEEWEVKKLKWLCSICTGKKDTVDREDDGIYPFFVRSPIVERISRYSYDGEAVLTAGDGVGVGKVFHYINGKFDYHQRVYKMSDFKKVSAKYFYYYIKENFIKETEVNNAKSTVDSIRLPMIQQFPVTLPSMEEQIRISNFLDETTAEIDGLIADKEKLIELLQEKRQAIISEVVTKGLNPNVRMKDSGVDWIGDIPEHWDIRRIKYLSNIRNVKASDSDNDKTYVGLESIESKTGKLLTNNNDEQQAAGETANIFRKGDVLFGKLRPYLAKCIVADFNGRCTSELLVLRTGSNMLPEYLYLFMLSPIFIDVVNSSTYGAKMPRASWDFIGNLRIPLPSIKEQEEIVEYLIKLKNNMDDLISDISTQIQKLKEYRQSLISEAVTGKIDVREFENISEVI